MAMPMCARSTGVPRCSASFSWGSQSLEYARLLNRTGSIGSWYRLVDESVQRVDVPPFGSFEVKRIKIAVSAEQYPWLDDVWIAKPLYGSAIRFGPGAKLYTAPAEDARYELVTLRETAGAP
jgi:hypothetical protein